ncbi:hypothetical protein PR048_002401 [Dryococelus australis]|uniref:Uncharacterized protein n=1 Tax=Dryococelus australis TaxID=614101 RepID=A0ABQ9ILK2_9NEOP|nr:hypothetical protein PR048_002401 [Dryococelus australis]
MAVNTALPAVMGKGSDLTELQKGLIIAFRSRGGGSISGAAMFVNCHVPLCIVSGRMAPLGITFVETAALHAPLMSEVILDYEDTCVPQQFSETCDWGSGRRVAFSDESRRQLHRKDVCQRVRRETSVNRHSASIAGRAQGPIIRVEGSLDQFDYESILSDRVHPYIMIVIRREDGIFQHDNRLDTRLEVSAFDCNADLNPIDHLWDNLNGRVRRLSPTTRTLKQLWDTLQTAWFQIPVDTYQHLTESLPARLAAVCAAKGDYSPPTLANRVRFPRGFSHVGIMADDTAGRQWPGFFGNLRFLVLAFRRCFILASLHSHRLSRPRSARRSRHQDLRVWRVKSNRLLSLSRLMAVFVVSFSAASGRKSRKKDAGVKKIAMSRKSHTCSRVIGLMGFPESGQWIKACFTTTSLSQRQNVFLSACGRGKRVRFSYESCFTGFSLLKERLKAIGPADYSGVPNHYDIDRIHKFRVVMWVAPGPSSGRAIVTVSVVPRRSQTSTYTKLHTSWVYHFNSVGGRPCNFDFGDNLALLRYVRLQTSLPLSSSSIPIIFPAYRELSSAFEIEKRRTNKDDTAMHIKCATATKRKACNVLVELGLSANSTLNAHLIVSYENVYWKQSSKQFKFTWIHAVRLVYSARQLRALRLETMVHLTREAVSSLWLPHFSASDAEEIFRRRSGDLRPLIVQSLCKSSQLIKVKCCNSTYAAPRALYCPCKPALSALPWTRHTSTPIAKCTRDNVNTFIRAVDFKSAHYRETSLRENAEMKQPLIPRTPAADARETATSLHLSEIPFTSIFSELPVHNLLLMFFEQPVHDCRLRPLFPPFLWRSRYPSYPLRRVEISAGYYMCDYGHAIRQYRTSTATTCFGLPFPSLLPPPPPTSSVVRHEHGHASRGQVLAASDCKPRAGRRAFIRSSARVGSGVVTSHSRALRHGDGNTARIARRSDEALGVRVSVARISPSLLNLGRAATYVKCSSAEMKGRGKREITEKTRIIRHDSQMRTYRESELRFVQMGGELSNDYTIADPIAHRTRCQPLMNERRCDTLLSNDAILLASVCGWRSQYKRRIAPRLTGTQPRSGLTFRAFTEQAIVDIWRWTFGEQFVSCLQVLLIVLYYSMTSEAVDDYLVRFCGDAQVSSRHLCLLCPPYLRRVRIQWGLCLIGYCMLRKLPIGRSVSCQVSTQPLISSDTSMLGFNTLQCSAGHDKNTAVQRRFGTVVV